MRENIRPSSITCLRRTRLLAAAMLIGGVLVAGCGGSSGSPTTAPGAASGATATAGSTAATGGASSDSTPPPATGAGPLAFAKCMRANGVPGFPDPVPGGGFLFSAGAVNPAAPAVMAARAKCRKLLPGGGPPGPGTQTHPTAQTLAKLLKIAECVRQHGISGFPDPMTSVPSDFGPAKYRDLTDFDGAILLFPITFNLQAPAYRQALATCGAPRLGLPH